MTDDAFLLGVCALAAARSVDDGNMLSDWTPLGIGLRMTLRNRPVPWVLFLATALAAIVLALR